MESFIKTRQNGDKLIHEGFMYVKARNGAGNKRYWKCDLFSSNKCRGIATTDENNFVTIGQQHNHDPSQFRTELARRQENMKDYCVFCAEEKVCTNMNGHFKK